MQGIVIPFDPILVHFGPISIRWFGLLVLLAIVAGTLVAHGEARRLGLAPERMTSLLTWVVPAGLVGARLLHLVDAWEYYVTHQADVLLIQQGGLSVWGAIVGGLVATLLYCRRHRLPVATVLDAATPGLILGLAIGRIGCFFNGDHQGPPTTLPWGTMYTNNSTLVPDFGVARHPTQMYEFLYLMALLGLIWKLRGGLPAPGVLFLVSGILYAAGRFGLGYLRLDSTFLFGLTTAQCVSVAALAMALPLLAHRLLLPPQRTNGPIGGIA